MTTYDLRGIADDFVIHYGGDDGQIDAFTFANSLTALGTALQAINREVNPGYSLEITVVALGHGSFRPRIKAKAKKLALAFVGEFRGGLAAALASYIVLRSLGGGETTYVINDNSIHINAGDGNTIILPRESFDAYRRSQESADLDRSLRLAFETLEEDDAVTTFGFARSPSERENLPFNIPRSEFADIARPRAPLSPGQKEKIEDAELQILRAIFEDSARRWQFVWRGIRISAPVLDKGFRRRVVMGTESFRHGDVLVVKMRIVQSADETGIWVNDAYEVMEVLDHRPRPQQGELDVD